MLETSNFQNSQAPAEMESDDICWICLDGLKDRDPLINPCKCPRKVHPRCLARWQLQQAGRPEETNCRFCQSNLADWKASLTPENLKPDVQRVQPIMVVYFEGQIHRIPVKQGPDGLKEFTHRIRELFRLPDDVDISLTFGCKEPLSGQHLKLEGIGAFDAAVHCASVAAAERQQKLKSGGGVDPSAGPQGPQGAGAGGAPMLPQQQPQSAAGFPEPLPRASSQPVQHPSSAANARSIAVAPHTASRQRLHSHYNSNHNNNLDHHHQLHHQHQQHQHLHHQFNLIDRSASAVPSNPFPASASAPASTQTSGGGADSVLNGGRQMAAAFPTSTSTSHYPSDFASMAPPLTSTVTTTATNNMILMSPNSSPPNHHQPGSSSSSFPGCVSFSEAPASAGASSSGGGSSASTSGGAEAAAYMAAAAPGQAEAPASSPLGIGRNGQLLCPSPFQMAALEACRVSSGCLDRGLNYIAPQQSQPMQPQPPQPQLSAPELAHSSQQTAMLGAAAEANAIMASGLLPRSALAGAISEPAPSRGQSCSPPTPVGTSYHGHPDQTQPQQQFQQQQQTHRHHHQHRVVQPSRPQVQPPMDQGQLCAAFPYSSVTSADSPSSPYASPPLPPLASALSTTLRANQQQQEQQAQRADQKPTTASVAATTSHRGALYASPSAASDGQEPSPILLTPRDHYVARCPSDSANESDSAEALPEAPKQQQQADQVCQHRSSGPSTPTKALSSANAGNNSPAGGPSTPVQPPARRPVASPEASSAPVLAAAACSPPASPIVSSGCRQQAQQQQQQAAGGTDVAGDVTCPMGANRTCSGQAQEDAMVSSGHSVPAAAANRSVGRCQPRPCQYGRHHDHEAAAAPAEADSAVVGSLTGRIKTSLKALSNKVRRSLNFQRGAGTCLQAHALSPLSSMNEADGLDAAETEEDVDEVGPVGCPQDLTVAASVAAAVVAAAPGSARDH